MGKSEVQDSGAIGVGDARYSKTKNTETSEDSSDIERGKEGPSPDNDSDEGAPSSPLSSRQQVVRQPTRGVRRAMRIPTLIIIIGAAASALILGIGISAARSEQNKEFEQQSKALVHQFGKAWDQYTTASSWVQQASRSGKQTREEFRTMYRYLLATGLEFHAIASLTNVTHDERATFENDTRTFMSEAYPEEGYYSGFTREVNNTFIRYDEETRPFYFPAHYVEPLEENWGVLDLDYYATPRLGAALKQAVTTRRPVLSGLSSCLTKSSVFLVNPGITDGSTPTDLSTISVRIDRLLTYISSHVTIEESVSVYVYDSTGTSGTGADAMFLGAAMFPAHNWDHGTHHAHAEPDDHLYGSYEVDGVVKIDNPLPLTFIQETDIETVRRSIGSLYEANLSILSRQWKIIVVAEKGTFNAKFGFVMLGSIMIFVACACLALWMITNYSREAKINEMRSAAESEKAALMVDNAHEAAKAERELNDFIAHEVRNPLSAAISATSFVSSMVSETNPLSTADARQSAKEDVQIIEASLHFINDLLRNMLDMHRASSNQLKIDLAPADLLKDVLEPVASMLYHRCADFEVLLDCPQNLVIKTDRLRLKQIVLNLGRNAAKFVEKGFVRLRADLVDGMVQVYVEDSGMGIPLEKRKGLFCKFQESLDSLNQGTGIGLCVCQNLIDLMHGEIVLDEKYESGMEGFPGSRFVIKLNTPAIVLDSIDLETNDWSMDSTKHTQGESESHKKRCLDVGFPKELPENLSVLFVDDDIMLRKLFSRSIRKLMPSWKLQEASNGETSLKLVDVEYFDLIFMDQYMASADKQLLGTETVRALRAKGVKSRICGLSANDLEKPFLRNGANGFLIKPFPCAKERLTRELLRILYYDGEQHNGGCN
jgi:signal transduction histidine kinase/CheY-like chemotaxis protein